MEKKRQGRRETKPNQLGTYHAVPVAACCKEAAVVQGRDRKRRGIWLKSGCWSESLLSASKVSESLHWRPLCHLWVVKNTFLLRGIKKKMERSMHRKVPLWITEGSQQDSSVCYYMDTFPIRALLCFLHPYHDCKFLKGNYTANVCPPIIWTMPASFTSFKRERTWKQRPLKIWVIRKKNTLHVSKNSYLQTRLWMPPSIPPHNRGHQSKQAVPCSSLMPWWQRRQALLWGLPERLPTSMSTHLSFLSKSNQPTRPQMGHCFSQMNSTAFWFVLATKTQLLYQFWGKHGVAKQDTRYFKLQLPQVIL